jgi:hypothetical protein
MSLHAPTRVIPQPVRGRSLHRFFWKRLHLPRNVVHSGLSAAKRLASPEQVRVRRRLADEILRDSRAMGRIDPADGYLTFAPGALPGTDDALGLCREAFAEQRQGRLSDEFLFNTNKRFLLSVLRGDDFNAWPDLVRFMVSREIVDTVTEYLGTVPLLAGAALWWSPANETATSSQLYHFDNEDWRQIKILINVNETTTDHGPFTLLPGGLSDRLREELRYNKGRVDDETLLDAGGRGNEVALVGAPGSGAFVDTSRCFHFGSRGNIYDRLVLKIQFMRFDSPTESTFRLQVPPDILGADVDEVQRLVLGIA